MYQKRKLLHTSDNPVEDITLQQLISSYINKNTNMENFTQNGVGLNGIKNGQKDSFLRGISFEDEESLKR